MKLSDIIRRFWELDAEKPFSPAETKLFFFLLNQATLNDSVDKWFECSMLPIMLPNVLPKMTLLRARDKLAQRGLIQYVSGFGKVKNPSFIFLPVTKVVTKRVTNQKEKVSPIPPLKEKIEREKENISKDIQKKEREWNLDFCLPNFQHIMEEWLTYKKGRNESYKNDMSIRKCYHNLLKISNSNSEIAQMIIDRSIANNWAGLFKLDRNEQTNQDKLCINSGAVQDQSINIYKEVFGYDGNPEGFEDWINAHPYGG